MKFTYYMAGKATAIASHLYYDGLHLGLALIDEQHIETTVGAGLGYANIVS